MKLICSYCRAELGTKEPLADDRISHTMCVTCFEHFEKQWLGQRLGEYLDRFGVPVLVLNADRRVVAANQKMADALGKSERELFGLLGGEAMECVYARLPEGCGETVHCEACTIRQSVVATRDTGVPMHRVPAYITRDHGKDLIHVSTELRDGVVIVTVEETQEDHASGSVSGSGL